HGNPPSRARGAADAGLGAERDGWRHASDRGTRQRGPAQHVVRIEARRAVAARTVGLSRPASRGAAAGQERMMRLRYSVLPLLFLLAACGSSPPTRFYTLEP